MEAVASKALAFGFIFALVAVTVVAVLTVMALQRGAVLKAKGKLRSLVFSVEVSPGQTAPERAAPSVSDKTVQLSVGGASRHGRRHSKRGGNQA